jgi:hypothetical protein
VTGSWIFLVVAAVGALFTWNAWRPRRRGSAALPSFLAGWPGWLALAITLSSWLALLRLLPAAQGAGAVGERALREALGKSWDARLPPAPAVAAARGRLPLLFLLRDAGVEEARDFPRELRARSQAPVAYAELPLAQHAFERLHSPRIRHVVDAVERFLRFVHAEHLARGGRTRAA